MGARGSRFMYFATPNDLKKILEDIDSQEKFKYINHGHKSAQTPISQIEIMSLLQTPNIGYSVKPSKSFESMYLVLPRDKAFVPRYIRDNEFYAVDQVENMPSVTWLLGGLWNDNCIIYGEVGTSYNNDLESMEMMKIIRKAIAKQSKKYKGWYISKEVYEIPDIRLILFSAQEPFENDLRFWRN